MKSKWVRILVICLVGCALLAGMAYGGYRGYKSWRQQRFVTQAKAFLEEGAERKAMISLQRAIRAKPTDVEAIRLMAGMMERERSPSALVWRQRVVDLAPDSVEDRLALAQTAISFRDTMTATNALAGVSEAGRRTSEFQNVAGGVASVLGQYAEAEQHFSEAARMEPGNDFIRLNLAVVRMQGTNETRWVEARESLEGLVASSTNSAFRCRVYRELIGHAMRTGETNRAVTLAERMIEEPEVAFSDRLLRLDVIGLTRGTNFVEELMSARALATNSVGTVNQMILWQMTKVPPRPTLEWIGTLPDEYRTNAGVALMTSDLQVAVQDWEGLLSFLDGQNWGALEFLRHAFRTLAMRNQGLTGAAEIEWGLTMRGTGMDRGALNMLLQTVARWRWADEMREILTAMVNRYPGEKWAADMLMQNLFAEGRTRSLMSLFGTQLSANPQDLTIKNNLAMTALLLDAGELRPHDLARQVYEGGPTNATYVSTYAFSLHLQEKHEEALRVMGLLTPEQLEQPSIAGYYALVLQANGRAEEARRYREKAATAQFLPEERRVLGL